MLLLKTLQKSITICFFLVKENNTCIQQGFIKLCKSDSKDIYGVTFYGVTNMVYFVFK